MPTESYRFDAPEGSKLYANDREYDPGDVMELPVGQVDPRLTRLSEDDLDDGDPTETETETEDLTGETEETDPDEVSEADEPEETDDEPESYPARKPIR